MASTPAPSTEGLSTNYVFNQYYWDFLKKVKDSAKKQKDASKHAKTVLRTIRDNYQSFDKLSTDHLTFFKEHGLPTWNEYQTVAIEDALQLFEHEQHGSCLIYKDISLRDIGKVLKSEPVLLHQYFTLFGILSVDNVNVHELLLLMKQFKLTDELKMKLEALPEGVLRVALTRLYTIFEKLTKTSSIFEEIEQTTLGKLAKEIMDDINLDELQSSVNPEMLQNGNIMDMFTKQDGGLAKIISTVSQKMVSKMASGEIQQEDLLKDALNVATKLPGMMPGGMGGDLGNIGSMLSSLVGTMGGDGSGSGGKGGGMGDFDISAMMKMMAGMNMGGKKVSKKHMNQAGKSGLVKTKLSSEMKRQRVAEKLRKQLDEKKKNLDGQLENDHVDKDQS